MSPALRLPAKPLRIEILPDRPLHRFRPARAIGGGLDGFGQGETAQIYTRRNLREMSRAGLGDLTYRLRTELGVKAWHVDPAGSFSNGAAADGYWTSASRPTAGLKVSWGYRLPRRGSTIDQANDSGFSRLDDGKLGSYWKSNPYLDGHYTHEPDSHHPQWVLIDLGKPRALDAIRIAWAAPYARRFAVQQFVGGADATAFLAGHWVDFPHGRWTGRGGTQTVRLSDQPLAVRFLRVLMFASSHTATGASHDIRDRLGYAIRELYVGTLVGRTGLRDLLIHHTTHRQSTIYVSSTDPWHRASDRDRSYEQPSFQTVLGSGLAHHAPLLVPVPVLYGTPENAVAELRYLHTLHVPLRGVELGEEPDGQLVSPEDYAALYEQFARAIRRAFPRLALGGPGFQTSLPDWAYWPDARGDTSWTHRFLAHLRARRALGQFDFFSFEWYPFDNTCAAPGPQLAAVAPQLTSLLGLQHRHGLPARLPVYVTEYGYSAFAGQDEVDLPGALLDAATVGTLLSDGGTAAYLYGYEPNALMRESDVCDTWGNLALIQSDDQHRARHRLAAFWETQMLTRDWTQPGSRVHTLYATRAAGAQIAGQAQVLTFAVRRPDGRLAVLLVNLSPSQPYQATVRLTQDGVTRALPTGLSQWQLSAANYVWRGRGAFGLPIRDLPPGHRRLRDAGAPLALPPFSLTVLRTDGTPPRAAFGRRQERGRKPPRR